MNNPFHYKNDRLFCEQIDLIQFAESVATPFYLYSQAEIEHNCDSVWQAAGNIHFQPFYALKANYNPAILKLILNKSFGADIVSGGELYFAGKAGFSPDKIVFAGVGKTDQEISQALEHNIHSINIESEDELYRIAELARQAGKKQRIAIRINPDIEAKTHPYISTGLHTNKFGVTSQRAFELYTMAGKLDSIVSEGIHVHIGSQITKESPYLETAAFLKDFMSRLKSKNIQIKYLDLGGGIGIDYEHAFSDTMPSRTYLEEILAKYLQAFKELNIMLFAELGRSIVGSAGILVTKVLLNKQTPLKKFAIVDAGMNNLIRPSLYQAKHEIVPLLRTGSPEIKCDIVGPVCESSDFFVKDYMIRELKRGELLAIGSAGAYSQALSSNYNIRPTIAEYLVHGDKVKCISKGKSVEDLAAGFEW
jgi:diaminopimelate decarboxylase